MKILYIAYSCNPYRGSEDKIGWNIPYEACKNNEVFVITKEEQRVYVEQFLNEHPTDNLHFYFVDIPAFYKLVFKGFLYSGRLNVWQKRAFPLAKRLCQEQGIEIIHQITPVEFRAIGDYGKIENIKFVCGPMGGGESVPQGLKSYAKGHGFVELVRAWANRFARRGLKKSGKLSRVDVALYANYETKEYLGGDMQNNADVMTEIGVGMDDLQNVEKLKKEKITFLYAGRLVYRKGIALLLDALEALPDGLDYECRIVGGGKEYKKISRRINDSARLKARIVLTGRIPFSRMQEEYRNADVFVMPSIRETTGSVILEAFSYGLPVITVNAFGGKVILDDECAWLYTGESKEDYVTSLKDALLSCIEHGDEVLKKGKNACQRAERYRWEEKVKTYQKVYEKLLLPS